ncbi:MAG: chalcone isomerase family protein [Acidobacteria bacterium]|nr:chalcone isomerase family protein [Acidobacteriota bacterium]MCG3193578.1 hypothetical protein [Thermoanaerobaculia bacterium]MCK6685481.1 chalcone isomerase family protein [Thermoanaerobaculia bacterium]
MTARTLSRLGAFSLAAMLFAVALPVSAKEMAGVNLPDTTTIAGKTLKLNGLGLRKKAIFKVYVGGLYLETPTKDANTVLTGDVPKAVSMQFLRSVERAKLVETYQEGFQANAAAKMGAQKANIDKFLALVKDVKDGTKWTFAYIPGTGTIINQDGKDTGTIEGKDFAEVLFSLWFGPKPPSDDLKNGMLGK